MRRSTTSLNRRGAGSRSTAARLAQRNQWMEGVEQQSMDLVWRTDRMGSIKTAFSPGYLCGLTMVWPQELKDCITECGLEGTMYLRPMNPIDRQHGLWLLNNMDPTTLAMRFRDGQVRVLDKATVVGILMLNGGPREVPVINPLEREVLMGRVLRLLGEDEHKPGGLTIKMLKEFLEMPPPCILSSEYKMKVKVAYTLLAVSCYLGPRFSNPTVSEEAMYIVLVPSQIGQYDLASYTMQVLRESAHRARVDQAENNLTILVGGCLAVLEVFSFDNLDIPEVQRTMHVVPRIAAYNGSFLRDLIKKESYDTGNGRVYGIARTVVIPEFGAPADLNGASSSAGRRMSHVERNLESFGGTIPTMADFVTMVMADQSASVCELFERVCAEYRQIDEQVEADRKRRRSEVNIAAVGVDLDSCHRQAARYTALVEKILAGSGVISSTGPDVSGGAENHGKTVPQESPVVHHVGPAVDVAMARSGSATLVDGHEIGVSVGRGMSNYDMETLAGVAQRILGSLSPGDKGKAPMDEGSSRQGKLPVRRPSVRNNSGGVMIREPGSESSKSDDQSVPIWDCSGGYSSGGVIPAEPAESPDGDGVGIESIQGYFGGAGINMGVVGVGGMLGDEVIVAPARGFEYSYHPSVLGLHHARYPKHWVDQFYDDVKYCTDDELERKWYKSCDREEFGWSIILSGKEIKDQMTDETEITYHTMAASNRDSNLRDRAMYANEESPWGAITEPDWSNVMLQIHFLYDPTHTSMRYIEELMSPRRIGYDVSRSRMIMTSVSLRDAWSFYAFDLEYKILNVLDPLYQGASPEACQSKHGDAAKCLLIGLRLCGERHGYGWNVVEKDWEVVYHTAMHPRCSHENTGVYVYLYANTFNGATVPGMEGGIPPREVSHQRRKMMYEINSSRSNSGDVPGYLMHTGW